MNILYINKFFYSNGGSEAVFFQERKHLHHHGHPTIDFSMEDRRNHPSKYSKFFVENIDYNERRTFKSKIHDAISFIHSKEAISKLNLILENHKADIAHLHNIYHQLTPSIIPVLKDHGIKTVLTLHDYKLICPSYLSLHENETCDACSGAAFWNAFTKNCANSRFKSLLLSLESYFHKYKKSYENVDLFIAPSQFMAEMISKRIPSDRIRILKNGIDPERYNPSDEDHGYALYLGRLSKEKGIETLLQAHEKMCNPIPLKIAGTGPLYDSLRSKYPEVDFLGFLEGNALERAVKQSSFVVVPSEWYENCSMTVLEAMAYGKPVIGSDIGGIPEQIIDKHSGLLFPAGSKNLLAESMDTLSKNKELRLQMGGNARKRLETNYNLHRHNNELIEIYEKLLQ